MRYLTFLLLAGLPLPALAVNSLTVNGATGGTLTPGNWVIACSFANVSDTVIISISADPDADGVAEAGEPLLEQLMIRDGWLNDENPNEKQVTFTVRLHDKRISAPIVLKAEDSTTAVVSHGYQCTYPAQGQTLSGCVYDDSGAAWPGLVVTARSGGVDYQAITGGDGCYTLSVPAGYATVELAPRQLQGGRQLPWAYRVNVTSGATVAGLNFRVAQQGSCLISGTAYDQATGRPVAGCVIRASGAGWGEAATDAAGHYRLLVPAGSYTMEVLAHNGWCASGSLATVPPDATFDPVLERALSHLSGRITSSPGAIPLLGARVGAVSGGFVTLSNINGWYQLWVVPGVSYRLYAAYPALALRYDNMWYTTGYVEDANFTLYPMGSEVSGRVSLSPSGAGLPCTVWATDPSYTWYGSPFAYTADGSYLLRLPPGSWDIAPFTDTGVALPPQVAAVPPSRTINFTTTNPGVAPHFSGGWVNPAAGLPTTSYSYLVTLVHASSLMPPEVCVVIDGVPYPMEQADPGDTNPEDGRVYVRTHSPLSLGSHTCRFVTYSEGLTIFSGTATGPVVGNSALDQPSLTPAAGTNLTHFTASVRYTHLSNTAPTAKKFLYRTDGGTWTTQTMTTADTTYSDGSTFTWSGHLPAGQIEYYFEFTADTTTLRLPAAGTALGPKVETVSLGSGQVAPAAGNAGTEFTFAATWTHSGGELPPADKLTLQLRKVGAPAFTTYPLPAPTGADPRAGAVFQLTLSGLADGSYEYYFSYAPIGTDGLRLPAAGTLPGPVVDANFPTVTISPAGGSFSRVVHITAAASDPDGIGQVEFFVDGSLRATDTTAPYSYDWDSWPLAVADGRHVLQAVAYDLGGHHADAQAVIYTDNTTFDDVTKSSSQWPYVEAMSREGITSGCSTTPPLYCPASSVTRAQMAVFICRAAGWAPYDKPTATFADVPQSASYYGYVEALAQRGVTAGCGGSPLRYCPNSPIDRGQMAVFLCRAAGWSPSANPTPSFADVPATASIYGYVEAVYQRGVTAGCTSAPVRNYCPTSPVTRGQMAVFLCRTFGIGLTP